MEDILEAIRFLATPFEEDKKEARVGEVQKVTTTSMLWLELCEKVWAKVPLSAGSKLVVEEEHEECSATWKLTCTVLDVLEQLKCKVEEVEKEQSEEEKEIEVLSVQSQSCILNCVELVIGFGVLPYLLPGVGIPNKYRKRNAAAESILDEDRKLSNVAQFNRLVHVLSILMDLCSHPTFANLIIPKHLNDILAGLFQTCKSPIAKPKADSNVGLTVNDYNSVMSKRLKLDTQFQSQFLKLLPKIMLVKSLLLIGAVQKPKWMMINCNDFLHTILLEKNGLVIISRAVSETLDGAKNWQVCKVVSNLVLDAVKRKDLSKNSAALTNLCSLCLQSILNDQEIENLQKFDQDPKLNALIDTRRRIGLFCATTLTNINNDLAQKVIWEDLFDSVLRVLSNDFTKATEIDKCAEIAQTLLTLSVPNDISLPIYEFQNLWTSFFYVLVSCEKYIDAEKLVNSKETHIILSIRKKLVDIFSILIEIISGNSKDNISEQNTCRFCVEIILSLTNEPLKALGVRDSKAISSSDINFHSCDYHAKESHEIIQQGCTILSKSILAKERLQEIRSQLFCQLLTYNQNFPSTENEDRAPNAGKERNLTKSEHEKFCVLMLMDSIASADENILENCAKINSSSEDGEEDNNFKVLELIFVKLTNEMESSHQEGENYEFNQSLSYVLGILGTLCETSSSSSDAESEKKKSADTKHVDNSSLWEKLESFVPFLQRLVQRGAHLNADSIIMAKNILTCIESRGAVSSFGPSTNKKEKNVSRYVKALQDVNSPLAAIKGHGILELKRLIEEQDPETISNESRLLKIFQNELRNDDSYVYLMAINGMVALGHKCHEIVMPTLIDLYDFHEASVNDDQKKSQNSSSAVLAMTPNERVEFRLKIGEILVKVIQKLGVDIAPLYRTPVTNVCFRLLRDEDESVRASALSNLGELCQVLKLALGNILTEVWYCVENLLESEQSCQVRRGALHLMVLLLRGVANELGVDYLIVNRDVGVYIRDARRLLSKLRSTETDPVSLTHVHLALDEISLIAAKFFMLPGQSPS